MAQDDNTSARPRWRSYLLLARISNLPTVWSNALAGAVAGAGVAAVSSQVALVAGIAAAVSLFYVGGMFLNDAFDAEFDAAHRPERPIPSRDVTRAEVFVLGGVGLAAGELLLRGNGLVLALGAVLAAAIVFYDSHHKGVWWAPAVMGSCRGLVYGIAAAALGTVSVAALAAAVIMVAYVAALTVVARRAGANARWLVPGLIAGISLIDSAVIASHGSWNIAALAACGFPLTLLLQRVVPGD